MSIVRLTNADKYYNRGKSNEIHVIDNISLELPESGMVAIFGRSGCGKTTLLNAIGGLDKTSGGSIEVFGESISGGSDNTDAVRNRYIGYIFQNYNLNVNETVYENVADALLLCGIRDEGEIYDRVMAALSNVGMDKYRDRTPDTLSGGQQQRVAIARAIVKAPAIILADEPTGNLDENNTVMVMDILKQISRTKLVLLVTHEANLVDYYCDRVIELSDGHIENIRENQNTTGYIKRDKNSIYLGELEKSHSEIGGIRVDYYGENAAGIEIKIVNYNGKLYLKSSSPVLKLLEAGSEVSLVDGTFEDYERSVTEKTLVAGEKKTVEAHKLDMAHLEPINAKPEKCGKLFSFGNSVRLAVRDNFTGKQKKGKKLLKVCMFMLSVVLVFMTAASGVKIKNYFEVREDVDPNIYFVPLEMGNDFSALAENKNGIAYAVIKRSTNGGVPETAGYSFTAGNFVTAKSINLTANGWTVSNKLVDNFKLICGETKPEKKGDIVITSAFADELIKSSTVSYIKSYENLLGLVCSDTYRIIGVVKSGKNEKCIFMDESSITDMAISSLGLYDRPAVSDSVKPGTVLLKFRYEHEITEKKFAVGDTVKILGRDFIVAGVSAYYTEDDNKTPEGETDARDADYGEDSGYDYDEGYDTVISTGSFPMLTFNPEDYIRLSRSIGETNENFGSGSAFKKYEEGTDTYYSHYMMIYASDKAELESFLIKTYGRTVETPTQIIDSQLKDQMIGIIGGAVRICVVLLLMCLCIYFMMRASFMSRIKEIGIMRAIGVTKKNIVFRFAIESFIVSTATTVVGYLMTSVLMYALSDAALFSNAFYFPIWLSIGVLIIVYACSLLFGIIPALTLLSKTPSEILAKYDI